MKKDNYITGAMDMKADDIMDIFLLWMAGVYPIQNGKESLLGQDQFGDITIEFPTGTPTFAVVREQAEEVGRGHRRVYITADFHNGKMAHRIAKFGNGKLHWEEVWENGVIVQGMEPIN